MKSTLIWLASRPAGLAVRRKLFRGSGKYWEWRYARGGTSGSGSYGARAEWKAATVNMWVSDHGVRSVIDWGCGDGNQLKYAAYPLYLGLDRSPTAIRRCMSLFADDETKSFMAYDPETTVDRGKWLAADLALSMEVIFHLTEDWVYHDYMTRLFGSAERFVVIASNDSAGTEAGPTERHRRFTDWVRQHASEWILVERVDPPAELGMMASLYLYALDRNTS